MNRLPLPLFFLALLSAAHAQLDVSLEMKRNIFMRGEPIEAAVIVRNLAGKDVMLRDTEGKAWFGFEIMRGADTPVAPLHPNYTNAPQEVLSNGSIRRTVDLLQLYPLTEFGTHTVRAAIYFAETGKYLVSQPVKLDISEGRKIWTQTVGVPASKDRAGEYHVVSLLAFQQTKDNTLYARIEDQATGTIFGTYPLGRMLSGTNPGHEFDGENTLHVFHMVGPGHYYLSKIGVNGEWLGQTVWQSKGRAAVRRKEDGRMVIVGATRSSEKAPPGPEVPRLSDRPAGLPSERPPGPPR